MNRHFSAGYSLIELIMVIVIVGIMATLTTRIITLPVNSYLDLERRTALLDNAETALRRMQRDIRRALPNSVRITGGGKALELLYVSDGGRYRAQQGGGSGDILDFTASDTSFDVIGSLSDAPTGTLVIYNLGVTGANAYTSTNRTSLNTSTATQINFDAKQFPFKSPQQRFYIVARPVTYRCYNNQLLRYASYNITVAQVNPPAGATGRLQANNVAACAFTYDPGTSSRAGLVTLTLTLTDAAGESAQLMHQVHVDNLP